MLVFCAFGYIIQGHTVVFIQVFFGYVKIVLAGYFILTFQLCIYQVGIAKIHFLVGQALSNNVHGGVGAYKLCTNLVAHFFKFLLGNHFSF